MPFAQSEPLALRRLHSVIFAEQPPTGTVDDDDEPEDEHEGENEAPIREVDENTEAPEEFEVDEEDELGHPEDDDADDQDPANSKP